MPRVLILLALAATSCGPDGEAGERLPCTYAPRATAENPHPELDTFADCAVREGGEVRIARQHLEALDFDADGLATMWIDGQWYYLRPDGTRAPVVTWDNGPDYFSEGLARTLVDGKIAYIDRSLAVVLPPRYDFGWPFEDGLAQVCTGCRREQRPGDEHTAMVGGAWGYIDRAGTEVVPVRYSREEAARRASRRRSSPIPGG